jgi:hypothetical protein
MTEDHPMVPTNEELKKWEDSWFDEEEHPDVLLIRAYQAGADAKLEACCEWLKEWQEDKHAGGIENLRAARRPKPPSLKEQAMAVLDEVDAEIGWAHYSILLRALEALPDD